MLIYKRFIMKGLFRVMGMVLLLLPAWQAEAQMFGQNKPRYQRFDFEVWESPHFTCYTYLKNPDRIRELATWAEHWYGLHLAVLEDTFPQRNPVLWYNHHAHFQQTNAIMGLIGQGTGGVTEAFKNRVVHPLMMTRKATHHVLGHELVHAFQYNMVIRGDSTGLENLSNLPLWLVEGLAEYLSIGRRDAHTSLWMRDAWLHDRIPSLDDLNDPRYFPYRYGQAFWSFLTGTWGDGIIRPFFLASAQYGVDQACPLVLGLTLDSLSTLWKGALTAHYAALLPVKAVVTSGKPILTDKNAGEMNLAPVLSPDGRFVIFVSEKDLFSLDMYIADARSGKILRKVASAAREGHVDDFQTIESSATWSPRSDRFAFVATRKGRNVFLIKDALSGRTERTIEIPGVEALNYPAWSPDGHTLAFAGMVEGESDIYTYDLRSGEVRRLTDGPDSEIMPAWSADGSEIAFVTDRLDARRGQFPSLWGFNLAIVTVASGERTDLDLFPGAENMNPQFNGQGDLLFLSNRDGFRNLYRYDRKADEVHQMTDLTTGISGITQYSPAMTVSFKRDRLLFTQFSNGEYAVYMAAEEDLASRPVDRYAVNPEGALLPVAGREVREVVNASMAEADRAGIPPVEIKQVPYKSRFRLDYMGGSGGVGIGTGNNTFGTGTAMMGGMDMLFSDVLGNHVLFATLLMNGEISDIGGQVQYLNQKNPVGWGARVMHIPFRSGFSYYAGRDTVEYGGQPVLADRFDTEIQRTFWTQGGVFAQYPVSPWQRFEVSANYIRIGFRRDLYKDYYAGNFYLGRQRDRLSGIPALNMANPGAAWVGDRSVWGMTAPLQGHRFRIGTEQYIGDLTYNEILADGRRYWRMRPVTLAGRLAYRGRHGRDKERLPMYIGDPTLVRGYSGSSFDRFNTYGINIDQLIGSSLLYANAEIRLPFTGPGRLALISSGFLFTDLNLFADAGIAFTEFSQLSWNTETNLQPRPVFSAGASLRINLFGALILEPFYAWPLVKNTKPTFGLNFIPGF